MSHIINVLGVIKVGSAISWHKDLQLFGPLSGLHLLRIFYPTLIIQHIFIQSTITHTLPLVSPIIWINIYVRFQLLVQNAVSAQPYVGKLLISHVLLNFLGCNFRW